MKIISGGQTGVDQIALEVAKELGVATGGWMPLGFLTETGKRPDMKELYGMQEMLTSSYPARTRRNIYISEGTVIFGNLNSAGSILTKKYCVDLEKPFIEHPTETALVEWILSNEITVLNVAGNRGSQLSLEEAMKIMAIIHNALKTLIK